MKTKITKITKIAPNEIEAESFRLIRQELGPHHFTDPHFKIVQRVIHATGDFSFADTLRVHPEAISRAMEVIRAGKNILTDVNMTAAGISTNILARFGGTVHCLVADRAVAELARQRGKTRSETAIEQGLGPDVGIVVIGNAPTALLKTMHCIADTAPEQRPLLIGVPVGFVNAAESKALLAEQEYPFITSLGRKGGSPVGAAIVNALLRIANQ